MSRPQEVVSGGGAIHFSSSEADREPAVPENPPAVPEEEGPSYAPIPSSSTPSYASSSISYPSSSSSSSSSAALPPSSSSSVAPAPSSTSSSSRPPVSPSSSASSVPEDPASQEDEEELEEEDPVVPSSGDEVRGIWLSYLDLGPLLSGKSESAFTASIGVVMDNIKNLGLNTVYAQVRPFGDI